MARIIILVEGLTEEQFVNELLRVHLTPFGYSEVSARLMGNVRQRSHRGGVRSWASMLADLKKHFAGDSGILVTTMVDYYAMPQSGDSAWPGRAEAARLPMANRAESVEAAMAKAVADAVGARRATRYFLPYVAMHEFEAMLFADPQRFADAIYQSAKGPELVAEAAPFSNPEEINDSPETAPSKRIARIVTNYEKPLFGCIGASAIGLAAIRARCPNFARWIGALEQWPPADEAHG
jgi:hypothetical protein